MTSEILRQDIFTIRQAEIQLECAIIANSNSSVEDTNKRIEKVQNAITDNVNRIYPWFNVTKTEAAVEESKQLKGVFGQLGYDLNTEEGLAGWEEDMNKFLLGNEKSKDAAEERQERVRKLIERRMNKRKKT